MREIPIYKTLLLLLLLLAAGLRWQAIDQVPPGLTHDEADHGLDAWGVVNGVRPIYFTVGYGREPLFDYSSALFMSFMGRSYLSGRITATFFSLLLLAATFAWVRQAFGRPVALLTVAGLAIGFWPLMTGRQALRSITLPALFALVAAGYWYAFVAGRKSLWWAMALGLLLGLTFYTYIPARILWAIFPVLLLYLALFNRPLFGRLWLPTLAMLGTAGLVALPLFVYLATHQGAEVRIGQLALPLQQAAEGNFELLLNHIFNGFRILTIEGDHQWRYNLPGRALLPGWFGWLFYPGLLFTGWQLGAKRHTGQGAAAFLAFCWLLAGLSPTLVTGPELSTTQAIGMQPVLYLFPALTLDWLGQRLPGRVAIPLLVALFGAVLTDSYTAYFKDWATRPEVRIQYEATLVETMRYLSQFGSGPVAISSDAPNQFHDPAVAQLTLGNPAVQLGWFDGRGGLLLPQAGSGWLVVPPSAAIHPALLAYLGDLPLQASLPMRPTDLDRPVQIYQVANLALFHTIYAQFQPDIHSLSTVIHIGAVCNFLGYDLQTAQVPAGQVARLVTLWQAEQPIDDAVLFTHVQGADGRPIAQADRLDVPSHFWREGDVFLQLHEITIPAGTPPGDYPLAIGLYTRPGNRLPVFVDGQPAGELWPIDTIQVTP